MQKLGGKMVPGSDHSGRTKETAARPRPGGKQPYSGPTLELGGRLGRAMVLGLVASNPVGPSPPPGTHNSTEPPAPSISSGGEAGAPCPDNKKSNCADSPSLGASGTHQQASEPPETASHAHPSASHPADFRPVQIRSRARASVRFPSPTPGV